MAAVVQTAFVGKQKDFVRKPANYIAAVRTDFAERRLDYTEMNRTAVDYKENYRNSDRTETNYKAIPDLRRRLL